MTAKTLNQLADLIDQVELKIEAGQATPKYLDGVQQKLNNMPGPEEESDGRQYQYALELQALVYESADNEEDMVRSLEAAVEQAGSPKKLRSHLLKTYLRKHPAENEENEPEVQMGPGDMSLLTAGEQRFMRLYGMDRTPEIDFLVRKPAAFAGLLFISGGLYGTYWFYKNWQAIRDDTGYRLSPFWRTAFLIFYAWPLFKSFALMAKSRGNSKNYSGGLLAACYILLPFLAIPVYLYSNSLLLVTTVEVLLDCVSIGILVLAQQAAIYSVSRQPSTKAVFRPINYVEWVFVVAGFLFLLSNINSHVQQARLPYNSGLQQIRINSEQQNQNVR